MNDLKKINGVYVTVNTHASIKSIFHFCHAMSVSKTLGSLVTIFRRVRKICEIRLFVPS